MYKFSKFKVDLKKNKKIFFTQKSLLTLSFFYKIPVLLGFLKKPIGNYFFLCYTCNINKLLREVIYEKK